MKKGVQQKTYNAIEIIEGIPTREALSVLYFNEFKPFSYICKKWNINNRTLSRIFKDFELNPRKGSEAVKAQWVNNPERRIATSNLLKNTRKNNPHPCLGIKRPDAKIRMTKFNPMFNDEIRKRANDKMKKTYEDNPKKRSQYHKEPTKVEKIVFDYFSNMGYTVICNEVINGRFPDIYIVELGVCIECVGSNRFPLSFDRHKQITSQNVQVIYCTNDFIKKSSLNILHNYVVRSDIFGSYPSLKGEESMIFGRRNPFVFDCDMSQFAVKIINVDKVYISFVSASAN